MPRAEDPQNKKEVAKRAKPDSKTGETKGERDFERQSDPKRGKETQQREKAGRRRSSRI